MNGQAASFAWVIAPLVLLAAAALTVASIALLYPVLERHALARPNARSSHREPTPQGGGIAVIAAITGLTLVIAFGFRKLDPDEAAQLIPVLAAASLLAV